jgi:hypothetical protein
MSGLCYKANPPVIFLGKWQLHGVAEVLNRYPTSKRTRPEMTQGRLSVKLMVVLVLLRLPFCGPIDVPTAKGFWTVLRISRVSLKGA